MALEYLELCVTTPYETVSVIMVEAFKKCLLLQLIEQGRQRVPVEACNLP